MWSSVLYSMQVYCIWTSPVFTLNSAACVSQKKQATDAACCGPGAGVRPHEWMDSCAAYISQKDLLLYSYTHKALHWGHMVMYSIRIKRTCVCSCAQNDLNSDMLLHIQYTRNVFMKNTFRFPVILLLKLYFHLSQSAEWTWHGTSYASTSICLRRQRHVPQFITNGRLCLPFMHEKV